MKNQPSNRGITGLHREITAFEVFDHDDEPIARIAARLAEKRHRRQARIEGRLRRRKSAREMRSCRVRVEPTIGT